MFCKLGFADESRPVAVAVWLKVVWSRPVLWVDEARQRVEVGAFEFGEFAVVENQRDDRVRVTEGLQGAYRRRAFCRWWSCARLAARAFQKVVRRPGRAS